MSTIQNVRNEHRKHIYKIAEKSPQYFEANECNHNLMSHKKVSDDHHDLKYLIVISWYDYPLTS